jgi:hypothetical protein
MHQPTMLPRAPMLILFLNELVVDLLTVSSWLKTGLGAAICEHNTEFSGLLNAREFLDQLNYT